MLFDNISSYYINPSTDDAYLNAPPPKDISKLLESSDDNNKIKGMKQLLTFLGRRSPETLEQYDSLLMPVIRFVAGSKNHSLRRLVHLYWEAMPKVDSVGETREEILLVSQIIRNCLKSSNEYVRGSCLRNLAKMCTAQILQTVDECIVENLSHPFAYVRRNAAMCVYALAQKFGPSIISEAATGLTEMATKEVDVSAQRAAILALFEVSPTTAVQLFVIGDEHTKNLGDVCQLAVIDIIRNSYRAIFNTFPPTQLTLQLQAILTQQHIIERLMGLLEGTKNAVVLEAASTLLWVSDFASQPTKAACRALVNLLLRITEINAKLIILDALNEAARRCPGVCDTYVVDVLRALSSPSLELRQKILDGCLPAISKRNVKDAVQVIRTSLVETMDPTTPHAIRVQCQRQLVRALRRICTTYPEVAESIIDLLLDFLTENESSAAVEVAILVREQIVDNESLRPHIIGRIVESLPDIMNLRTLRMSIWLVGEFCSTEAQKADIINTIFTALSPFPLPEAEADVKETETGGVKTTVVVRTIVLPDGSYGTENVIEELDGGEDSKVAKVSEMRVAVTNATNTLLTSIIGVALAKLSLRSYPDTLTKEVKQALLNKTLLILTSLIKFSSSSQFFGSTSALTIRLKQCLKAVVNSMVKKDESMRLQINTASLAKVIEMEREAAQQEELNIVVSDDESFLRILGADANPEIQNTSRIDDIINYRIVTGMENASSGSAAAASAVPLIPQLAYHSSVSLAVQGRTQSNDASKITMALLRPSKAIALSGYADPVYVEGVMQINHLDLIIELLLVNQTGETLHNVSVSVGTHGDLKILEKPRSVSLEPGASEIVFASIKLSSTEAGVIFGYCSLQRKSSPTKEYFNLNELQIDLLDCIQRAWIGNLSFRSMWSEFEWENKIAVQLPSDNVFDFLSLLLRQTKMTIVGLFGDSASTLAKLKNRKKKNASNLVTDEDAGVTEQYIKAVRENPLLKQMATSRVFAVNLCSKSIFGEDALLNLSLERKPGALSGSVRIRSRTQGIALSLGDRIAQIQRAFASTAQS